MAAFAVPVFPEKAWLWRVHAERVGEILNTEVVGGEGTFGRGGGWGSLSEKRGSRQKQSEHNGS